MARTTGTVVAVLTLLAVSFSGGALAAALDPPTTNVAAAPVKSALKQAGLAPTPANLVLFENITLKQAAVSPSQPLANLTTSLPPGVLGNPSTTGTAQNSLSPSLSRNGTASPPVTPGRRLQSTPQCSDDYLALAQDFMNPDFASAGSLFFGFCPGDDVRGQYTQDVATKAYNQFNGANVMVFATDQQPYNWDNGPNGVLMNCYAPCKDIFASVESTLIPIQFEVWVFNQPSSFTNRGDGGFINWCFIANSFNRDGGHVDFN